MEEKTGKDLGATSLGSSKVNFDDSEVDTLIKETIEASKGFPKEEKTKENILSGTPISISKPAEKKPTPAAGPASKPEEQKTAPPPSDYEKTFKSYKVGEIVKGKVLKIDPGGVLVDIKYKSDGLILPEELSDKDSLKVGDEIDVLIENLETKEGYVRLSKKKADDEVKWNLAYEAYKNRKVLESSVVSAVKGGLVVDCIGIRGFIPASQVVKQPDVPLEDFVNKKMLIKIIQLDKRQGRIVFSHKLAESEKQVFQAGKLFDELEIGQVRRGKVTSLKKFGAFVNLGGIEGLIHITELSWKRVSHPSEVLKIGEEIDVFILGVDKINKKVALGLKELQPDPWVTAKEKYKVGQIVKAKVARLTKFGAFVTLDDNLEGLVHLSELAIRPVNSAEEVVKPGDEIDVKILRILPEEQKIGLSIREVLIAKEKQELKEFQSSQGEAKVTIGDVVKIKTSEEIQPQL